MCISIYNIIYKLCIWNRMKLSRNKIQKIRKQQHQSVRKWKKHYKSSGRRTTFRQSRRQNRIGIYSPKVNNVMNRTLKKYISSAMMNEAKELYKRMRRQRRKQKNMKGGATPQEIAANAVAIAAAAAVMNSNESLKNKDKSLDATTTATDATTTAVVPTDAATPTDATTDTTPTTDTTDTTATATDNTSEPKKSPTTSAAPFSLGPEIKGDISIGTEVFECKTDKDVYHLVQFLIEKGLPFYVQIELKSGDNPLNKNDTNIFDLRRILYGKFTQDIKKIPENKRQLYLEMKDTVGVANGSLLEDQQSGLFIYTGEKGQILKDSTDSKIQVRLLQDDPNAPAIPTLTDSTRLYKLQGQVPDAKPASIDSMNRLTILDKNNKIDTSEFRLQVAPMTESELNKDAQNIAAGNSNDPEAKIVIDESNTYIVNLAVGCKVTSIQTLKKSLEKARLSLESDKDQSKKSALDIFKLLNALLQNPEFAKSDGYDDFKNSVLGFSYKVKNSERMYGFTQMQTFFGDKKDNIPKHVIKEFFKLMNLLGNGPGGANGDCLRFDGASQSIYELSRIQTFEEDGKIVTKKTETLDSASNMNGFMKQLSKLGSSGATEEKEEKEEEGTPAPANEVKNDTTGAAGERAAGVEQSTGMVPTKPLEAQETAAADTTTADTTTAAAAQNPNLLPLTQDQIKEIDAVDSNGTAYKAYLIRKFKFDGGLPTMNLVHFMGWGKGYDEYIPEPKASTRIFERGKYDKQPAPITGQEKGRDDTLDLVMKLYEKDDMAKLEGKARTAAQEYKDDSKLSTEELAAMAAATAAATAAVAAGKP